MAYNEFTLSRLRQKFGLRTQEVVGFYKQITELPVPETLATNLERGIPLGSLAASEKAKSEFLVSPMLVEVKVQLADKINLFSGVDFPVDPALGLNGRCDFVLARGPSRLDVVAPVCMIVEAKLDDFLGGIPQAIAEIIAARRFNESFGTAIDLIFGAVTSGMEWLFLQVSGDVAIIDLIRYPIENPGRIYAILRAMALGEVPG